MSARLEQRWKRAARAWLVAVLCVSAPVASAPGDAAPPRAASARTLEILEYRVDGVTCLTTAEVERALEPFLGPGRNADDVELARAALEKAYSDRGYPSVAVSIPPQTVKDGVVLLHAAEATVGRLRVRGARWFTLSDIKALAPSVAEGTVPNFNQIVNDIVALNQVPDRRVTPALRAGAEPGTVDVDLVVQDRVPFHGSIELNNRYSVGTTPPRISLSMRYDNLWQEGHSLSFSTQLAPERPSDARIFSAGYLARIPGVPWLTFSLNGVLQLSDLSTLGAIAVQGRGRILGGRFAFTLPSENGFFHSLTAGLDYKYFGRELSEDPYSVLIEYWPLSLQYNAAWAGERQETHFGATATLGLRGLGSGADAFDARRYDARGSFTWLRIEASRAQDVLAGFQIYGHLQGQLSFDALVPAEQLTAGGAESMRGYLEAQAAGDSGGFATVELRSPPLISQVNFEECRLHVFVDGARISLEHALPEQSWLFILWSTGVGLRLKLFRSISGAIDLAVPLRSLAPTYAFHPRAHFRLGGEF